MTRAERYFEQAIREGSLSHAYLLEGEEAGAVKAASRRIVRRIACEKGTGCGECASCRAFDAGSHPDIIVLQKEKDAPSVREVREQIVDDVGIRPYRFARKIYLIDEAEKLNVQSQNTLLKTLEEPPAYAMLFLVTTNRNAFLPTILSRVVSLRADETGEEGGKADAGESDFFAALRRAEFLSVAEMSTLASDLKGKGLAAEDALELLRAFLRDVLAAKAGAEEKIRLTNERDLIFDWAARLDYPFLNDLWEAVLNARAALIANVNPDLVMQLLFLKINEGLNTPRISD